MFCVADHTSTTTQTRHDDMKHQWRVRRMRALHFLFCHNTISLIMYSPYQLRQPEINIQNWQKSSGNRYNKKAIGFSHG